MHSSYKVSGLFLVLMKTLPDVVILTAMGEEAAVEAKEAPRQG